MSKSSWNSDEDDALRQCTWMARLVYLQGIRRAMDYRTGIAGRQTVISYQRLTEILDCTTHTTAPDPVPTKRMLQRAFESLERAGLVRWIKPDGAQRGIVFECLLADRDDQVQKQAVPKRYPSGTQEAVPINTSNHAASGLVAVPEPQKLHEPQAVPPPESGYPLREFPPTPPSFDLPPTVDRDVWEDFEAHRKELRKPLTDRQRRSNARVLAPLSVEQQRVVVDATISNAWTGLFPPKINGHGNHIESTTERRDRINREFIEAGIRAAKSEMG